MSLSEFEKRLWLSSVALARLDAVTNLPTGYASGALIDYSGKRLLLSVWHATGDQLRWSIQVKYVPGEGTHNYVTGPMNFLSRGSLLEPRAQLEPIDFSYAEVKKDLQPLRKEIAFPDTIKSETPVTIHTPTLTDEPVSGENYGFSGLVLATHEEHFGVTYVERQPRIYSGLSFSRTEKGYHYFSLPFPHPGHEQFQGCSGAPVLSEKGAFVGLLCGGKDAGEIKVIAIRQQKTPVDILVGNI